MNLKIEIEIKVYCCSNRFVLIGVQAKLACMCGWVVNYPETAVCSTFATLAETIVQYATDSRTYCSYT